MLQSIGIRLSGKVVVGLLLVVVCSLSVRPLCAAADIVSVSLQGVLVEDSTGLCTTFEGDDGFTYILSTMGTYTSGDRIHVTGSYDEDILGTCFTVAGPFITVTEIRPAFAGIGTLVVINGKLHLESEDGRLFRVQNLGGYGEGTDVYVQGTVIETRGLPLITGNVIGPAFASFGRIAAFTSAGVRFVAESGGLYLLDRPGSLVGTIEGDFIYVEGIVATESDTREIAITSVTARPAFEASGIVVAVPGGVALDPETLINFGQTYSADALAGFAAGTKVYVRGRSTDDYDYGEVKPVRNVRKSRAGMSYSGVGTLDVASGTMSVEDGTVVHLEHLGNGWFHPDGSLIYVAGEIEWAGSGSVTLGHNQVKVGLSREGVIFNGFGCTPIIVFDEGGYIFPRNNDGLPIGEHVRVVGGVTLDVPCSDFAGLVDNTIEVTPFPCINCE